VTQGGCLYLYVCEPQVIGGCVPPACAHCLCRSELLGLHSKPVKQPRRQWLDTDIVTDIHCMQALSDLDLLTSVTITSVFLPSIQLRQLWLRNFLRKRALDMNRKGALHLHESNNTEWMCPSRISLLLAERADQTFEIILHASTTPATA
jgi:hypothetical protein